MNTGGTFEGRRCPQRAPKGVPAIRALTLIEIMVTVTLLVVIILGLTAMFNQTRKAFTVGLSNVDYQDAGRAAMDLISRDLQQMAPGNYGYLTNYGYNNSLNFYADLPAAPAAPVYWPMTAGDATNFSLGRVFFTTSYNRQRTAIGYRLLFQAATNGIGTLYRYSSVITNQSDLIAGPAANYFKLNDFLFDPAALPPPLNTNLSRVIDGVVDFRIRAYDRNGVLIPTSALQYDYVSTNSGIRTDTTVYTGNASNPVPNLGNWMDPNVSVNPVFLNTNVYYGVYRYTSPNTTTGDYFYSFYSNAVPAYVDIELGIMETPTYQQLQAFTSVPATFASFLTSHAAQVHIFRQRVTIPSTDPAAYP